MVWAYMSANSAVLSGSSRSGMSVSAKAWRKSGEQVAKRCPASKALDDIANEVREAGHAQGQVLGLADGARACCVRKLSSRSSPTSSAPSDLRLQRFLGPPREPGLP